MSPVLIERGLLETASDIHKQEADYVERARGATKRLVPWL